MMLSATSCPMPCTTDDYLRHVALARAAGRSIIPPRTRAELLALAGTYPALARAHRPASEHRERCGLPPHWPDPPQMLTEREQERIVATLVSDDRFARALIASIRRYF